MGCLNSKAASGDPNASMTRNSYHKKMSVVAKEPRQQQGVSELKKNYIISKKSKQLGSGAFGSVFKTSNIHNPNHHVAIKVLDKIKLE
jgi:hypothetical protein